MPIDPSKAIGAELPDQSFAWTESDVLLYHLGIGFGSRPGDNVDVDTLRFTTERSDLQVLPSFGVVVPTFHETAPPSLEMPGVDISLSQVVHGTQEVEVHRPVPTSGSGVLHSRISDVWDKGKAAVIVREGRAVDGAGDPLFTTRSSIFVRGEGGFGGERGPSSKVELPTRAADLDSSYLVTPQQALLYRLCGDRNPLHSSPSFAEKAGFPVPILHGLCSYGIVLREVVQGLLGSDATAVRSFAARFAGIVFPGETIQVQAWDEGERILVAATIASEVDARQGAPVLADCVLTRSRA